MGLAQHGGRESATASRWPLAGRFVLAGAAAGLLAGVVEAALLGFIPRATGLLQPDVHYVIAFIAPLVDLLSGALLGLVLGSLASLPRRSAPAWVAALAGIGLGIIIAYVAWMVNWFTRIIPSGRNAVAIPLVCFVLAASACFCAIFFSGLKRRLSFSGTKPLAPSAITRSLLTCGIVVAVLSGGIIFYSVRCPPRYPPMQSPDARDSSGPPRSPNIALIVLDTVRADHLSCYGYSRPVTPNLDQLAARGVRFENAIAPSSWTLPSLAAIFTGLLPHQSGANWGAAIGKGPWTLAKILRAKGYETAGFNANPFYGLAGWRLDEGFDIYVDESYSVRHNLAVTFVGQSALRALYNRVVRYNQFDHRTAADVNGDVIRWEQHRNRSQPFFLFINYMDAHRPYLPPALYDKRFGKMSGGLLATVSASLKDGHPPRTYSAEEQRELIDGYDNSLAFLDAQLGRLIAFLRQQPGGRHTVFIVTADHGEGFGEHGTYDHGWNLYEEVLRVPLIIAGPGIPRGLQVPGQVGIRDLFPTVLDLALGLPGPIRQASLRQAWESPSKPLNVGTVSELAAFSSPHKSLTASLSFMTPRWHLIEGGSGRVELYDEQNDPKELHNVSDEPGARDALASLVQSLESRIAYSTLPWRDVRYLGPLDRQGRTFVQQIAASQVHFLQQGLAAGSAQAYFSGQPPAQLLQPNRQSQDLLRTLPYH